MKHGGIKLIHRAEPWDRSRIDTWMKKIDQLTPTFGTPLVRTICMAVEDFPKGFDGRRSVVVLTDGADSNFDSGTLDQDLKKKFGDTIPDVLNKAFAKASGPVDGENSDKEIQLYVIGFEVSAKEKEERSYPDFVKALKDKEKKGTGKYYDAQDAEKLAQSLRLSLLHTSFGVEEDSDHLVRDLPPRGNSITQIGENIGPPLNLCPVTLSTGGYLVFIPTMRSLRQRIAIDPGDYLLLELVENMQGMAFRRSLFSELQNRGKLGYVKLSEKRPSGWSLAALQNRQLPGERNPRRS